MLHKQSSPTPFAIKQARKHVGLIQDEAAALVDVAARAWWRYEKGINNMSPSAWEYFLLKTEQHPDYVLAPRPATHQAQSPS
jgi:DNA-binding XRE family transcriptional regulator